MALDTKIEVKDGKVICPLTNRKRNVTRCSKCQCRRGTGGALTTQDGNNYIAETYIRCSDIQRMYLLKQEGKKMKVKNIVSI